MQAKSITRDGEHSLVIIWSDDHKSTIPLELLRKECPCANCKGEVIFGKVYRPVNLPVFTPGMNELKRLSTVGHYGLQADWADGHNTGIYSWDFLRALCPCEDCVKDSSTVNSTQIDSVGGSS